MARVKQKRAESPMFSIAQDFQPVFDHIISFIGQQYNYTYILSVITDQAYHKLSTLNPQLYKFLYRFFITTFCSFPFLFMNLITALLPDNGANDLVVASRISSLSSKRWPFTSTMRSPL